MTQQTRKHHVWGPPPLSTVHGLRLVWSNSRPENRNYYCSHFTDKEKAARLGTSDLSSALVTTAVSNRAEIQIQAPWAQGSHVKSRPNHHLGYHTMQDKGWAQNQATTVNHCEGPWWWYCSGVGSFRHRRGSEFHIASHWAVTGGVVGNTLEDPVHGRRRGTGSGMEAPSPGAPAGSGPYPWIYRDQINTQKRRGSHRTNKEHGSVSASIWMAREETALPGFSGYKLEKHAVPMSPGWAVLGMCAVRSSNLIKRTQQMLRRKSDQLETLLINTCILIPVLVQYKQHI